MVHWSVEVDQALSRARVKGRGELSRVSGIEERLEVQGDLIRRLLEKVDLELEVFP